MSSDRRGNNPAWLRRFGGLFDACPSTSAESRYCPFRRRRHHNSFSDSRWYSCKSSIESCKNTLRRWPTCCHLSVLGPRYRRANDGRLLLVHLAVLYRTCSTVKITRRLSSQTKSIWLVNITPPDRITSHIPHADTRVQYALNDPTLA